ncbi:protein EMSY-like isoform X2 [Notothenia coriiceps]|uniref:Protein EMSY-like isoform X2 n=1 Tax=Notothenia coriiceps TaxID=8208 RepID=A0A6I9N0X6_9TELE|nr:PREDICTED: protein EMSY-like isoform X2 [Notothenia coriiceps]
MVSSREHDWTEQEISVESSPTIIYQEVSAAEAQSATSTIKALLELQQTSVKEKAEAKPRQHTIDLSQMAVPLQLVPEKKPSPESPRPSSSSEAEPSAEHSIAGTNLLQDALCEIYQRTRQNLKNSMNFLLFI